VSTAATSRAPAASATRPGSPRVGSLLRAWQRAYRSTPNFRGKGRVLFDWPGRLIHSWPSDVEITSGAGCVFRHCDLSEYLYRSLFFFGCFEPDVDWACRRVLRPGDTFVDKGACFGYHTLTASLRVGPGGRIYAIEPQPDMFAALEENALCNKATNIVMDNLALSDRAESLQLHRFAGLGVGHTSIATMGQAVFQVHSCPAITLDEFIGRRSVGPVALVKLDVEGAEMKILRGAQALLQRPDPPMWVLEVNVETAQACGYQPSDLLAFLSGFGYQAYRPVWGELLRQIRRFELCPPGDIQHGQNLLCAIPAVHAEALARAGAAPRG